MIEGSDAYFEASENVPEPFSDKLNSPSEIIEPLLEHELSIPLTEEEKVRINNQLIVMREIKNQGNVNKNPIDTWTYSLAAQHIITLGRKTLPYLTKEISDSTYGTKDEQVAIIDSIVSIRDLPIVMNTLNALVSMKEEFPSENSTLKLGLTLLRLTHEIVTLGPSDSRLRDISKFIFSIRETPGFDENFYIADRALLCALYLTNTPESKAFIQSSHDPVGFEESLKNLTSYELNNIANNKVQVSLAMNNIQFLPSSYTEITGTEEDSLSHYSLPYENVIERLRVIEEIFQIVKTPSQSELDTVFPMLINNADALGQALATDPNYSRKLYTEIREILARAYDESLPLASRKPAIAVSYICLSSIISKLEFFRQEVRSSPSQISELGETSLALMSLVKEFGNTFQQKVANMFFKRNLRKITNSQHPERYIDFEMVKNIFWKNTRESEILLPHAVQLLKKLASGKLDKQEKALELVLKILTKTQLPSNRATYGFNISHTEILTPVISSLLKKWGIDGKQILQVWKENTNRETRYKYGPDYNYRLSDEGIIKRNLELMDKLEKKYPGICLALKKTYGIENFARIPEEMLVEQYESMKKSRMNSEEALKETKPILVVSLPKTDWNGSFYGNPSKYLELAKKYAVKFVEYDNKGKLVHGLNRISRMHGKIAAAIISAHGNSESISLGNHEIYGKITSHDRFSPHFKRLGRAFDEKPIIIFQACSTGLEQGIIHSMSLTHSDAIFIGPREPASVKEFIVKDQQTTQDSLRVVYQTPEGQAIQANVYQGGIKL